ncbi:hypothetical protein GJ744_007112 [Endocarpon pusillum]|uniref:Uncharacterized protein n=1 Tax=Endocarpon pusillum TaxID=364733 RepID=A0A8H7AJ24_9EURO|nr:hypothetical protein GJ744_007112 [Endocarpon pusillum]
MSRQKESFKQTIHHRTSCATKKTSITLSAGTGGRGCIQNAPTQPTGNGLMVAGRESRLANLTAVCSQIQSILIAESRNSSAGSWCDESDKGLEDIVRFLISWKTVFADKTPIATGNQRIV